MSKNTIENAKDYLVANLEDLIINKLLDDTDVELLAYALQRYAGKQIKISNDSNIKEISHNKI